MTDIANCREAIKTTRKIRATISIVYHQVNKNGFMHDIKIICLNALHAVRNQVETHVFNS